MELLGMIFICGFLASMGTIGVFVILGALALFGVVKLVMDKETISRNTIAYVLGTVSIILLLTLFM